MFEELIDLRLLVVESCNSVPRGEQESTAWAWIDILELEASRLAANGAAWLPVNVDHATNLRRRHADRWGRLLGRVDARLALIVADQAVAALIRGHLTDLQESAPTP